MSRKVAFTVREEGRHGGLVYTYPCGHEYYFDKEALHEHITAGGPDAPRRCPEGCGADMNIIER